MKPIASTSSMVKRMASLRTSTIKMVQLLMESRWMAWRKTPDTIHFPTEEELELVKGEEGELIHQELDVVML